MAVALATLATLLPMTPASASHGRLAETRREISATRSRLAAALNDDVRVRAELASITSRLHQHEFRLAEARGVLRRIDLEIRGQERRLRKLAARQAAREGWVGARARSMYIMGPGSSFEAFTQATDLNDFIGRAVALDHILEHDRLLLEDLAMLKDESRKARVALREQRRAATAVRDDIAERVESVGEFAAVKQEAHNTLQGRINSYRAEIAALQREQSRILVLIRSRQSISSGPISRSGFAWPIRGRITSPYGPRWGGFHTGIDIDCVTGNPIGASKTGRVIASEWGGGYGRMVIVDHGGGVTTLYAHMSSIYVGRGDRVSQLQKIGACGATGRASGDHLHFEVRENGNHRNPLNYLP